MDAINFFDGHEYFKDLTEKMDLHNHPLCVICLFPFAKDVKGDGINPLIVLLRQLHLRANVKHPVHVLVVMASLI